MDHTCSSAPGELLDFSKLPARLRALVWLSGGRVRWRTIQGVLDAGYVDAFRALQPDLVGYSLGGGVALFTAVKYPNKVRKLVAAAAQARVARCSDTAACAPKLDDNA